MAQDLARVEAMHKERRALSEAFGQDHQSLLKETLKSTEQFLEALKIEEAHIKGD